MGTFKPSQDKHPSPGKLVCAALLLAAVLPAGAAAAAPASDSRAAALQRAQRRVVKTYGAKVGRTPGYATGMIVGPEGKILTASGTYLNGQRVRVGLPDGSIHLATVERRSRALQLAILQIPVKTPDYFDLSQRPKLSKGQWLLTLTNAFKIADGTERLSVSLGIMSLRTRLEAKRGSQPFAYEGEVLLIDSITSNPGAPGGAVITEGGQLAGIVGPSVESGSTGTHLNYAIPVDVAHQFLTGQSPTTDERSVTARPYLGIRLFKLGGKDAPAYVDRVAANSPAAKAGLRPDDLILAVGDERIKSIEQYEEVIRNLVAGKEVVVTAKRKQQLVQLILTPTEATD